MDRSITDLILRQRIRMDTLAMLAGRFLDDSARRSIERMSGRMARIGATLGLACSRRTDVTGRVQGHLERLVREVSLARVDEPDSISRVSWVLAEIEEAIRQSPIEVERPVYTAN